MRKGGTPAGPRSGCTGHGATAQRSPRRAGNTGTGAPKSAAEHHHEDTASRRTEGGRGLLSLDLYLVTVPSSAANPPSGPVVTGITRSAAPHPPWVSGGLRRAGALLRRVARFPAAQAKFVPLLAAIRGGVDGIRGRVHGLYGRAPVCLSNPVGKRTAAAPGPVARPRRASTRSGAAAAAVPTAVARLPAHDRRQLHAADRHAG